MGVLGAANIARKVVIPAILRADGVELVAIGSASGRGAEFVAEAGLAGVRACTYEELLADPDVEAVYIHSRIICTPSGRCAPPTPASTCSARSPLRALPTRPHR